MEGSFRVFLNSGPEIHRDPFSTRPKWGSFIDPWKGKPHQGAKKGLGLPLLKSDVRVGFKTLSPQQPFYPTKRVCTGPIEEGAVRSLKMLAEPLTTPDPKGTHRGRVCLLWGPSRHRGPLAPLTLEGQVFKKCETPKGVFNHKGDSWPHIGQGLAPGRSLAPQWGVLAPPT